MVIETLSPGDTVHETLQRLRDYASLGVPYIIQMDPESQVAHRFDNGSLLQTRFERLELRGAIVPFDSEALFAELRREAVEATGLE